MDPDVVASKPVSNVMEAQSGLLPATAETVLELS